MSDIYAVDLSKPAEKQLEKIPTYIVTKLETWVDTIMHIGLRETMKVKGYHDEPLDGKRKGQRSIRLSKSYRAIYKIINDKALIEIIEVNKHDY